MSGLFLMEVYNMLRKRVTNNAIRASLTEKQFKKDTNPHKYAILWSSRLYKVINEIMRNNNLNEIQARYPYTLLFLYRFVEYFERYGKTKKQLISNNITKLYRGLSSDFIIDSDIIHDTGFVATSAHKSVAQGFARQNGTILVFKVEHLPDDVKFALINQDINDAFMEAEVLFLPGTINVLSYKDKIYTCKYKMNGTFLQEVQNIKLSVGGGKLDIPEIPLNGKLVIWYRAIKGRPVEFLGQTHTPSSEKKIFKYMKDHVLPTDDRFHRVKYWMTEFQDMKTAKEQNNIIDYDKYNSFSVYMAVYDPKTKQILTLHYGMPDDMFSELFDKSRTEEVKNKILSSYGKIRYG